MIAKALLISSKSTRLNQIAEALEKVKWEVVPFSEPIKALKSMQQQSYDAIFCDEELRGASIKGFLTWHERLNSDSPFYVIGNPSPAFAKATKVISFPVEITDLPNPQGASLEPTQVFQTEISQPDLPFAYKVNTVSLSGNTSILHIDNVLEMMGMGKQDTLISLGKKGSKGEICLENGFVLHASFIDDSGVERVGLSALVSILAANDLAFQVEDFKKPKRNTVNLQVAYALTEAARLVDEHKRYRGFIEAIKKACPSVTGVALGYGASLEPLESFGEQTLFKEAQGLLKRQKKSLGSNLSAILVVLGDKATVLETFGEGALLVASASSGERDALYNIVRHVLKQT